MEINQPRIDLKKQPTMSCEECKSEIFQEIVLIKKVPKLLTGSLEDTIVPFPSYRCADCGHVNEDFRLFDENNKTNLVQ